MKLKSFLKPCFVFLLVATSFMMPLLSCQTDTEEVQHTLTIEVKDTLSKYDAVTVVVKTMEGKTLTTINLKKVTNPNQLKDLPIPGYDGGKITVVIIGYKADSVVFTKNYNYDGVDGKIISSTVVVSGKKDTILTRDTVKIIDTVIHVDTVIKIDTTKRDTTVKIDTAKIDTGILLQSLSLVKDSVVFRFGDTATIVVDSKPVGLNPKITWRLDPIGIVTISDKGKVQALKDGNVVATAVSALDTTKRVTVRIRVLKDIPVLHVGKDTVLAIGMTATFTPTVTQVLGLVTLFQWDLNGDSLWEGSATTVHSVTKTYTRAESLVIHFRIVDSEGNASILSQGVNVIDGLAVQISSPKDSAKVNSTKIRVRWSVNGLDQKVDTTETLVKNGFNTIIRSAKDALEREYFDTIHVFVDTTPPQPPVVTTWRGQGQADLNARPIWTWVPASTKEAGIYRISFDSLSNLYMDTLKALAIQAPPGLKEGPHSIYVQERDSAGNWSLPGSAVANVDTTPPAKPILTSQLVDGVQNFQWVSGGGGSGWYYLGFDDSTLRSPSETKKTSTSLLNGDFQSYFIGYGKHAFYIREMDSLGNKSPIVSYSFTITEPTDYSLGSIPLGTTLYNKIKLAFGAAGEMYLYTSEPYYNQLPRFYKYNASLKTWTEDVTDSLWSNYLAMADDGAGNFYWASSDDSGLSMKKRTSTGWVKWGTKKIPLAGVNPATPILTIPKNGNPYVFTNTTGADSVYRIPNTTEPIWIDYATVGTFPYTPSAIWDTVQNQMIAWSGSNDIAYWTLNATGTTWTQLTASPSLSGGSLLFTTLGATGDIIRAYGRPNYYSSYTIDRYNPTTKVWAQLGETQSNLVTGTYTIGVVGHPNGSFYQVITDPYFSRLPSLWKLDTSLPNPIWKRYLGLTLLKDGQATVGDMKVGPDGKIYVVLNHTSSSLVKTIQILKLDP